MQLCGRHNGIQDGTPLSLIQIGHELGILLLEQANCAVIHVRTQERSPIQSALFYVTLAECNPLFLRRDSWTFGVRRACW